MEKLEEGEERKDSRFTETRYNLRLKDARESFFSEIINEDNNARTLFTTNGPLAVIQIDHFLSLGLLIIIIIMNGIR